MSAPKQHPNTPGFWLDYRDKVAAKLPNQIIKKGELDRIMTFYINDHDIDECVAWIIQQRRNALL